MSDSNKAVDISEVINLERYILRYNKITLDKVDIKIKNKKNSNIFILKLSIFRLKLLKKFLNISIVYKFSGKINNVITGTIEPIVTTSKKEQIIVKNIK